MSVRQEVEIAIVGGGPAGAALAIRLAAAGRDVALFERRPTPRWRAGGVYSSPRTRGGLASLGVDGATLDRLIRPIAAMEVRTLDGTGCRFEHRAPYACGVDRVRLERALLDRASAAGARVHEGHAVRAVVLAAADARQDRVALTVTSPDGHDARWTAALVIGADGPRSTVARAAGVARPSRRFRRAGITVHHHDPDAPPPGVPAVARLAIGPGWYLAAAPVPGGRINVGLVTGERRLRDAVRQGRDASSLVQGFIDHLPGPSEPWRHAGRTDAVMVALPLAHRPTHLAGAAHLLVGDAAGFIDPLSGEGLHRALVSAAMASCAIERWRAGRTAAARRDALAGYERAMRTRFLGKDAVSWLLQAFLSSPVVTRYALARLDRRMDLRRTFNGVLTDLMPASRVVDPRFLARLMAP